MTPSRHFRGQWKIPHDRSIQTLETSQVKPQPVLPHHGVVALGPQVVGLDGHEPRLRGTVAQVQHPSGVHSKSEQLVLVKDLVCAAQEERRLLSDPAEVLPLVSRAGVGIVRRVNGSFQHRTELVLIDVARLVEDGHTGGVGRGTPARHQWRRIYGSVGHVLSRLGLLCGGATPGFVLSLACLTALRLPQRLSLSIKSAGRCPGLQTHTMHRSYIIAAPGDSSYVCQSAPQLLILTLLATQFS